MDRIATPNAKNGRFQAGDSRAGVNATELSADWCNGVQETLIQAQEAAGIAPGPGLDHLARAIRILAAEASDRPGADALETGGAGSRIESGRVESHAGAWIGNFNGLSGEILGSSVPLVVTSRGRRAVIDTDAPFTVRAVDRSGAAWAAAVAAGDAPGTRGGEMDRVGRGAVGRIPLAAGVGASLSGLAGRASAFQINQGGALDWSVGTMGDGALVNLRRGWLFNAAGGLRPAARVDAGNAVQALGLHMVLVDADGPQVLAAPWPREGSSAPQSPSAGDLWLDRAAGTWRMYTGALWEARAVVPVAMVVTNPAGDSILAYRCLDLAGDWSRENGAWIGRESANVMASGPCKVSVAGSMVLAGRLAWDARSDFLSGDALAAGRAYLYIDRAGKTYVSMLDPIWRPDLLGRYHRGRAWRCLGEAVLTSATEFAAIQYLVNERYSPGAPLPAEASARIRRVSATSASIEPIGDADGFRPEAGSTSTQVNFEIPFAFAHRGDADADPVVDVAPLDPDVTKITRIRIVKNAAASRYDVTYRYAAGEGGGAARQDAIIRAHLTGDARLQALVDARTR